MKVKSLITYDFIHIKLISKKGNTKCKVTVLTLATLGEVSTCSLFYLLCVCTVSCSGWARATPPSHPSVLEISQRDTPQPSSSVCTSRMVLRVTVSLCQDTPAGHWKAEKKRAQQKWEGVGQVYMKKENESIPETETK